MLRFPEQGRGLLRSLTAALCCGLALHAAAHPCEDVRDEIAALGQGRGSCLPTAAAMALACLTHPIQPSDIARQIPMYADGANFFDLQNELTRLGYDSLIFVGRADEANQALRASYPVIAAVLRSGHKHAVLVGGFGEPVAPDDEPSFEIADPDGGRWSTWSAAQLERSLYAGQMMVIFPAAGDARARLANEGFPLEWIEAQNRRFRAQAWVLRAQRHERPSEQQVELLRRAADEDLCWSTPYDLLAETHRALGRVDEATAASSLGREVGVTCEEPSLPGQAD